MDTQVYIGKNVSVYKYSQSKTIDEVTFKKSEGGHGRAFLHAADGADSKVLHDVTCAMAERGWQVTPYNQNGKPVLEVLGPGSEQKLIEFLGEKGWVQGQSQVIRDKENKSSFKETIKKRSLAASGAFYLVGDAAFTRYGYKGGSWENMVAGLFYGAGTLSLLGGGRKDQSDLQIREVSKQLSQYMKDYGANLPKDCSLDAIANDYDKGLIKKADDVLRRYPSELMNLFFAVAGAFIARSAYKYNIKPPATVEAITKHEADKEKVMHRIMGDAKSKDKQYKKFMATHPADKGDKAFEKYLGGRLDFFHKLEGILDIGLGSFTGASGLFALSVKEKAHDPDAPPKHGLDAIWAKIQERPLAIAGYGYMVSTMCHALSTKVAWDYASEDKRKSVKWRGIFIVANVAAEILLAISSKGHGHGVKSDGSVDETVIALAAEAIAKQPANLQNLLIEHVGKFLGRPDTLALKDENVQQKLREQVELMRNNPWALAVSRHAQSQALPAATIEAKPATEEKPCPTGKCPLKEPLAWQGKLAQEKAAASQSQPQISG